MPRHLLNGLSGAVATLALLLLLRLAWAPDPAQSLFARAQRLESAGQVPLALRHYRLISDKHPESFYAPRALLRQGDLLSAQGRQSGDKPELQSAVAAYARLAKTYPSDPLVSEALLDAAQICAENLGDRSAAKGFYTTLLSRSGARSDAAAIATVKLGRLALDEHDGKTAQTLLQRVLRVWPRAAERGAEAQFYLGVAYETLFKNREWAKRAYDAVIARYPTSTWANDARGRLGLIVFGERKPPARRVLVEVPPLPDDGGANGSLWTALRPVLAAHGLEADAVTLRGWSLAPFYAGYDPENPARVVTPPFDAFENVLANAGLRFSVKSGGKADEALRDLQDELDAARAPLVYFEDKGVGQWALCVGYDSERGEVLLQSRGARFDTIAAKTFAEWWHAKSSFGTSYTFVSLLSSGVPARSAPSLTPTPAPTLAPDQTPAPQLETAPAFVWRLPALSLPNAQRRALGRAATLLERPRQGTVLLNAAGLSALASELKQLAGAPPSRLATPTPSATFAPTPSGDVAVEGQTPDEAQSPYAPDATPTSAPTAAPARRNDEPRARALLAFLGAPARAWANSRREAAAWCDAAANDLHDPSLKRAATALRQSTSALEAAIALAPANLETPLGAGDRAQLGEVAREIERARDAERLAAQLMR